MSRVSTQARVSANFGQTWKRKREEDDEHERERILNSSDLSADDSHVAGIEWMLTFCHPRTLSIVHKRYTTRVTNDEVQIGTVRETINSDGTTATFRGTDLTALEIHFTLTVGHMTVKWMGGRICIDNTYAIDESEFVMCHRPPQNTRPERSVNIICGGGCEEPMTLTHGKHSYIIRFQEGYPAMVIPRCTYYPLKLSMMKDFIDKFVPKELFGRPTHTPDELADDPRIPDATPNTPDSNGSSDESSDALTPPSQYRSSERMRMNGLCATDEWSDE